jgi:MoxR-like ATPase
MSVNLSLLEFVKNMNMKANYQPIVIKMLLESESHFITIQDIRKKFDELNFGRGNFVSSEGNSMGNNAIDSVKKALKNYVIFPEGTSNGNVTLIEETYDESHKDEYVKICGQEITKWHINHFKNKEIEYYFIQAGRNKKYLEEFKKENYVAVDYLDDEENIGNFDLSGLTKEEIKNKNKGDTSATELYNISQIKNGDIVAVVIGSKTVEEFAIATSDYYFEPNAKKNRHRVKVEYLNFGTPTIGKGAVAGIIRDDSKKIKNFLSEYKSGYFLVRYNGKNSPFDKMEQWKDILGEQYHFSKVVPNSLAIRKSGIGTKTIWFKTKNLPGIYFWGYDFVEKIRINKEKEDWNLMYSDFKYFDQEKDSILEEDVFLKKANESIEKQIKDLPGYNQSNSIITITKKIYQQIIGEDLTPEEDELEDVTEHFRIIEILKRKKNIILYGPPGTGKTFTATEIAKQMNGITKSVTFHQSYGYEEFIEGIRPQSADNGITYPVKPGVFKKFCQSLPIMNWRQAAIYVLNEKETSLHYKEITKISIELKISPKDTWQHTSGYPRKTPWLSQLREMTEDIRINNENSIFKKSLDDNGKEIPGIYEVNKKSPNYENEIIELESLKNNDLETPKIFIIDEINRGNISKIFGELITIIENDKRGTEVTLSYSGEQFSVPSNVFIIGTMNTADQSLTHIDAALKRRFSSIEVMPDSSILEKGMKGLPELLDKINEKVREKISRDNQIGHSYFMTKDGKPITEIKELQFVFATDIIPLLRDYFYDSDDDLKEVLGEQFIDWNEGSDRNVKEDWQNNAEVFRTAIKKAYDVTI